MNKRILLIPIGVIMIAVIAVSAYLLSQKPDTSKIDLGHKIAEYTKPAVVRTGAGFNIDFIVSPKENAKALDTNVLSIDYGFEGSGAIISTNGYIVTNAHVVQLYKMEEKDVLPYAVDLLYQKLKGDYGVNPDDYSISIKKDSYSKWLKVLLPGGKLYDADLKSYGAPVGEGKDVAVIKIDGMNFPSLKLGDSSGLSIQDSVWICGFPVSGDSELLSQNSQLIATINSGKISAIDKQSKQGSPIIQVDGAATHGNSGGPVVAENGDIIGLLTFGGNANPITQQQPESFSFVVPSSTVKEFVNQSGAGNDDSDVNRLYKQGLELYWGGYYKDALSKFEQVQRLFPTHSEVQKYATECQAKSGASKVLWSDYTALFVIFDLIIVALLILAGLIVNSRTRQQVAAAQADRGQTPSNAGNDLKTVYEPQNKPSLYCAAGIFKGTSFEMDKGQLILGRDPNVSQIIFPKEIASISRKHCTVYYDTSRGTFVLIDNNSSYGTFLEGGEKLQADKQYALQPGKRFYLSDPANLFEVRLGR